MRTKTGITAQDAHELHQFVKHLEGGNITTAELKNVLIVLRQYSDSGVLWEWANSVAHKKRDKGEAYKAGANLWLERFQIYAYFSGEPDLEKIPIPIFETLVDRIKDEDEQIAGSLVYMYQRIDRSHIYKLIPDDQNVEDLLLIKEKLPKLVHTNWSKSPFTFKKIIGEIASEFQRLIGIGKRKITKHKDLIAVHFLCAFHQTEIALQVFKDPKTRCYLSVDSNEGKLSLNLALYHFENGNWKQLEIADGTYNPHTGRLNHCYSRPYLLTNLSERKYLRKPRICSLFQSAVEVRVNWIYKYIGCVEESFEKKRNQLCPQLLNSR